MSDIMSLLRTPADSTLNMYRVSQMVNAVGNNSAKLHEEEPEPPTLFS
jgi:putative SOS response-associated peptidase YedK